MTEGRIGWTFVAVQMLLLLALVLAPDAGHWSTSGIVDLASTILVGVGLVIMVAAALRLGPALTPTPVPNSSGRLTTHGLYRYCRHPIYSGILVIVTGLMIGSGSLWVVALGVLTIVFFNAKANWEESQLARRFPAYESYVAATPRFVPRVIPRRRPTS